jgi:hypothetical protein
MLSFHDYRSVHLYIVYRTNKRYMGEGGAEKIDFLLIQTFGDDGEKVPPEFSDAPMNYFQSHSKNALVDPHHLFPGLKVFYSENERIGIGKRNSKENKWKIE